MPEPHQDCLEPIRDVDDCDAAEIRRRVLVSLRELMAADGALFFKYALDRGTHLYTGLEPLGDDTLAAIAARMEGRPTLAEDLWDPTAPTRDEHNNFTKRDYPLEFIDSFHHPIIDAFYRPCGVRTQLRALFYDGPNFLGWLGCWRTNFSPFQPAEIERARSAIPSFKAALMAADRREPDFAENPGQILLNGDATRVEATNDAAADWLHDSRREHLARIIRNSDGGEELPPSVVLDGRRVHLVRMIGAAGTRYLATLESVEAPRLSTDTILTPRQLEVAEFAAVGATAPEIARELDVAPATVRSHLKEVYRRLGIGSRAELALRLADREHVQL